MPLTPLSDLGTSMARFCSLKDHTLMCLVVSTINNQETMAIEMLIFHHHICLSFNASLLLVQSPVQKLAQDQKRRHIFKSFSALIYSPHNLSCAFASPISQCEQWGVSHSWICLFFQLLSHDYHPSLSKESMQKESVSSCTWPQMTSVCFWSDGIIQSVELHCFVKTSTKARDLREILLTIKENFTLRVQL